MAPEPEVWKRILHYNASKIKGRESREGNIQTRICPAMSIPLMCLYIGETCKTV